MLLAYKSTLLFAASLLVPAISQASTSPSCVPPPGFVDTPRPTPAPLEQLVPHTEEIIINRPLAVVLDAEAKTSLEKAIDRNSALPGVSGTYLLTKGEFGQPGSRRITCLTDGSSLEEEVLENVREQSSARFRYVVWNYTTEKARSVAYSVGLFVRSDLGDGRTRVRWTYSFRLNEHKFPGYLGSLGAYFFRVGFLDRQYAEMMRGSLAGGKARIEAGAAPPGSPQK